jgi:hypothetical protein
VQIVDSDLHENENDDKIQNSSKRGAAQKANRQIEKQMK